MFMRGIFDALGAGLYRGASAFALVNFMHLCLVDHLFPHL